MDQAGGIEVQDIVLNDDAGVVKRAIQLGSECGNAGGSLQGRDLVEGCGYLIEEGIVDRLRVLGDLQSLTDGTDTEVGDLRDQTLHARVVSESGDHILDHGSAGEGGEKGVGIFQVSKHAVLGERCDQRGHGANVGVQSRRVLGVAVQDEPKLIHKGIKQLTHLGLFHAHEGLVVHPGIGKRVDHVTHDGSKQLGIGKGIRDRTDNGSLLGAVFRDLGAAKLGDMRPKHDQGIHLLLGAEVLAVHADLHQRVVDQIGAKHAGNRNGRALLQAVNLIHDHLHGGIGGVDDTLVGQVLHGGSCEVHVAAQGNHNDQHGNHAADQAPYAAANTAELLLLGALLHFLAANHDHDQVSDPGQEGKGHEEQQADQGQDQSCRQLKHKLKQGGRKLEIAHDLCGLHARDHREDLCLKQNQCLLGRGKTVAHDDAGHHGNKCRGGDHDHANACLDHSAERAPCEADQQIE